MTIYDLSKEAVSSMVPADLEPPGTAITGRQAVGGPPPSPIGEFQLNGATCGVGCFKGRPPWECHTEGDELLHVLAGEVELTLAGEAAPTVLGPGSVVVVPQGRWHRNHARQSVTLFYVTPTEGNRHSWDDEPPFD